MNTTNSSGIDKGYDYNGAAIYTAGILIYYSTGLVLMLFFHVRPRELQNQSIFDHEEADQSIKFSKNPFAHYNHVQTNNTQKQILNELKDPERRERLWKIYYSSREKHKEPHPQYYQTVATESATIGRINRKLATIHQMSRNSDADVIPTVNMSSSNSSTNFLAKSFNSLRRFSGQGRAQPPRPIVRVQSEPETPSLEFHPINFNIEPQVTSINERSNVQQTKIYLNRFTIERVSDEDLNLSIENKT
jgi:hypothetical protein